MTREQDEEDDEFVARAALDSLFDDPSADTDAASFRTNHTHAAPRPLFLKALEKKTFVASLESLSLLKAHTKRVSRLAVLERLRGGAVALLSERRDRPEALAGDAAVDALSRLFRSLLQGSTRAGDVANSLQTMTFACSTFFHRTAADGAKLYFADAIAKVQLGSRFWDDALLLGVERDLDLRFAAATKNSVRTRGEPPKSCEPL